MRTAGRNSSIPTGTTLPSSVPLLPLLSSFFGHSRFTVRGIFETDNGGGRAERHVTRLAPNYGSRLFLAPEHDRPTDDVANPRT